MPLAVRSACLLSSKIFSVSPPLPFKSLTGLGLCSVVPMLLSRVGWIHEAFQRCRDQVLIKYTSTAVGEVQVLRASPLIGWSNVNDRPPLTVVVSVAQGSKNDNPRYIHYYSAHHDSSTLDFYFVKKSTQEWRLESCFYHSVLRVTSRNLSMLRTNEHHSMSLTFLSRRLP